MRKAGDSSVEVPDVPQGPRALGQTRISMLRSQHIGRLKD